MHLDLGFLTLQLKMHIFFLSIGLKDFLNISIENSTLLEKVMQVILYMITGTVSVFYFFPQRFWC